MATKHPVKVTIPEPEEDSPSFSRLAIIVVVCFVVGAVAPHLANITLVPRVPGAADKEAVADKEAAEEAPKSVANAASPPAAAAAPAVSKVAPAEPAGPELTKGPSINISKSLVVSCRDAENKKVAQCDKPALDEVAVPKLQALVGCASASSAEGVLSVGLELDFRTGKVLDVVSGSSTTVAPGAAKALIECAKAEFASANLAEVPHEQASYLYYYVVDFIPPGTPVTESPAEEKVAASGTAVVMWETAQIRSTSGKDSEVRARILYGARVVVLARQGDWYEVKYDGRGRTGWIHRNAIGK